MSRYRAVLVVLGLSLALTVPVRTDPQVVVNDLGIVAGTWNSAEGINNSGQIVGSATTAGPPVYAVLWDHGTTTVLPLLCAEPTCWATAYDINDLGDVVGFATFPSAGGQGMVAALWHAGSITALQPLPGDTSSTANGINNLGVVVGVSSRPGAGSRAVRWVGGVAEDLGSLGSTGIPTAVAQEINDAGQITGTSSTNLGVSHAFIWQNGTMNDLGGVASSCPSGSSAFGINESGQVAGSVGVPNVAGASQPCVSVAATWSSGSWTTLPLVHPTLLNSIARNINDHGDVAGFAVGAQGLAHGFLWRNGEAIDLGALPFTLPIASTANDLNDAGLVVGNSRIDRSTPPFTHAVTYEAALPNTAPTIHVPADITVYAAGAAGAQVNFDAHGNDIEDDLLQATCTPDSGTVFPLGTTLVECVVTDSGGLQASGSFHVVVLDDPDDDHDGVLDVDDAFPLDPAEWLDTDHDGIGNNADADDDNDGQLDLDEIACGSNPLDQSNKAPDYNNNGRPDCIDPPPVITGANAQMQSAAGELSALRPGLSASGKRALDLALARINRGLSPAFWTDANHLAQPGGQRVFYLDAIALHSLMTIRPRSPQLDAAMVTLVSIDRTIASLVVTEALAAHGDASLIVRAIGARAAGDAAEALGQHARAVERYRLAWWLAGRAARRTPALFAPMTELTDTITGLAALAPAATRSDNNRLARAIAEIQGALDASLWVNTTHVSASRGQRVFQQLSNALDLLDAVTGQLEAVDDASEAITAVTRLVAETAIEEAATDGTSARTLDRARAALAAGDNDEAGRRNAIDYYKRAWILVN